MVQNLIETRNYWSTTTTTTPTPAPPPPPPRKYTLLWYVNADNNLGLKLFSQVQEAFFAFFGHGKTDEFAINILVDQSEAVNMKLFESPSSWSGAHNFRLGFSGVEDDEYWGEVDMDNASTLTRFIKEGKRKYPADHYILLLSGHGAGLQKGYGGDTDNYKQAGGKYFYDP